MLSSAIHAKIGSIFSATHIRRQMLRICKRSTTATRVWRRRLLASPETKFLDWHVLAKWFIVFRCLASHPQLRLQRR